MSNPQQETKIELVTEAIEALVLAVTAHQRRALTLNPAGAKTNYDTVRAAREEVHDALKELLQPVLRVVCTEKIDEVGEISTTLRRTVMEHIPAPDARPVYPSE